MIDSLKEILALKKCIDESEMSDAVLGRTHLHFYTPCSEDDSPRKMRFAGNHLCTGDGEFGFDNDQVFDDLGIMRYKRKICQHVYGIDFEPEGTFPECDDNDNDDDGSTDLVRQQRVCDIAIWLFLACELSAGYGSLNKSIRGAALLRDTLAGKNWRKYLQLYKATHGLLDKPKEVETHARHKVAKRAKK